MKGTLQKKKNSIKSKQQLFFNHDEFFREVFSDPSLAQEIFQFVFSKTEFKLFNWLALKEEKSVFGKHSRADLVFSVPLKKKNTQVFILLLLEHKSRYDDQLLYQLLRYQVHIYQSLKRKKSVFFLFCFIMGKSLGKLLCHFKRRYGKMERLKEG